MRYEGASNGLHSEWNELPRRPTHLLAGFIRGPRALAARERCRAPGVLAVVTIIHFDFMLSRDKRNRSAEQRVWKVLIVGEAQYAQSMRAS